jgi:hypothetical protein
MIYRPADLAPVVVTTAGVPVRISASTILTPTFTVQADPLNSGKMALGASSVNINRGISLDPGEVVTVSAEYVQGLSIDYDLSDWWADSAVNGNSLRVIYYSRS